MLPLVKCSGGYHTTLDENGQQDPIQKQVNCKFKEFNTGGGNYQIQRFKMHAKK